MILGDSYITFNRKILKLRGHYVSLESKVRGHLKQKQENLPFSRDMENRDLPTVGN